MALTPDELLTTTRAVRRRLDLSRPVDLALVRECLEIATQAPTGSNAEDWSFVVVTDPAKRAGLAALYKTAWDSYAARQPIRDATHRRVLRSASYLAERLADVPVHVIPCVAGRTEGMPTVVAASRFGSVLPAMWSFMLAARARGLGTVWTTLHLAFEREAAELLGIPYETITQAALVPVAHTIGTDFRLGPRIPLESVVHWDGW